MKEFGPDYYNITEMLTEEELLIQKTANDFVLNEFKPLVNEHYENGTFPKELISKLGDLGFMGSSLPEEFGGSGVSNVMSLNVLVVGSTFCNGLRAPGAET